MQPLVVSLKEAKFKGQNITFTHILTLFTINELKFKIGSNSNFLVFNQQN